MQRMYILILLLFLFIITYEFRRTFLGGLEDRIVFFKNVFSVLLNKRKKRYFQADHPKVGYLSRLSTEMKKIRTILLKSLI